MPLASSGAEAFKNEDCLDCHNDPANTRTVNGKAVPLELFTTNKFEKSVHAKLACVDCHQGMKDLVHESKLPEPTCVSCHQTNTTHLKAAQEYATSIHGASHSLGASGAASCWDCHGSHSILPVKSDASSVFKLNLPGTCAACHSNAGLTKEYQIKYPEAASQYMDSIHGQKLLKQGLLVAPSCNDCHGVHDIKRAVDRDSPINPANVAKTCGKCHYKIEETYMKSVHGQLLAKGDKQGPVCTDCHTAHSVEAPHNGHFKMASDKRCGRCHEDSLLHYRDTYHGKAMALGKPNVASDVAACYDCHGHHDVLPPSHPESRLSKTNIVATCKQCHPDANPGFASYKPHANPLDGQKYPVLHGTFLFMTTLLIGVFVFFGGHTAAWLFRAFYLYLHDSKKFREAKIATQTGGEWFTRFAPFDRFLHFLVVTSFLLLVITGMPLKFYYTDWAKTLFQFIGGAETARALHRLGAIVTFLYFGLHVLAVIGRSWRGRNKMRDPKTGAFSLRRGLAPGVRSRLHGPHTSGLARFCGAQQVVLRQRPQAGVRPLDLLGEVRLLRRVLGRVHHRLLGSGHVVPGVLHPLPSRMDHQRRADHSLGRSPAGRRVHLLDSFLQHAFPDREIPDGHRHLLRPRLEERNAPRAPALV